MRQADYAILAAILAVAIGICAAMFLRPGTAEGVKPVEFADEPSEAAYVAPKVEPQAVQEPKQADEPAKADEPEQPNPGYVEDAEVYAVPEYTGTYYAEYDAAYNEHGPTRDMPGWYDGYLETYYSSNVMRHYLTDTWTVDDEGFYRDSDGRYIVGVDIAEGIEIGTVVDTGRGEAVVMDYGSGAHVHDFYTNW